MYKYNIIVSDTNIFQFLLLRIVLKQNLPSEATKDEAAAKVKMLMLNGKYRYVSCFLVLLKHGSGNW